MTKRLLLAIAALVIPTLAYAAVLLGPMSSGSSQIPPATGTAPVVASLTCDIALPVANQNVVLTGGGTCSYTATCNAASCTGMDAITSWAITTQSTANAFALGSTGTLKGGSAAGSVTTGAYTVTVTATNATGTSPGVVQTINAFAAPVVATTACTIQSPITHNVNVALQGGGNCQYSATCSGGACSGANAITAWTIASQTCTGCYQVTAAGVLQGGANATNVGNTAATINLTATNAGGTSPIVAENIAAITVPVVSNKNFSVTLPWLAPPQAIGTMTATANPASWAITAVSGDGAGPADFAISNSGVISTTASTATDITAAGTVTITVTAANATGTSAPATAALNVVTNPPPLVQSKTCNVTPPVTNGVAVNPSCTFTATCGGGACIAPYAITGWTIVSQTHASGFTISSAGVLQGGVNGATTTGANTVTVTATNSVATSPAVGETVNVAGTLPVVTNGNYTQTVPLAAGNLSPAMTATCGGVACSGGNAITTWAVTGASGDNAQLRDFSISNSGVLALTSFAPTDITTPGIVTINVSATNVAGAGTGTATLTVNGNDCLVSTGGTITVVGGNRIHTFTSSGTFTAGGACTINYLIVGGGGGGGAGVAPVGSTTGGGGGGCGGVIAGSLAISSGPRTITIGAAGAGNGGSGGPSTISGINTASGGGAGGTGNGGNGLGGACGGGGAGSSNVAGVGGTPSQGGGGGSGSVGAVGAGGGGGGIAAAGTSAGQNGVAGAGGNGIASSISGVSRVYGCGGGGGGASGGAAGCAGAGAGGTGVGGAAGGTANFYGDGGGGGYQTGGGAGFGGIVVISYPNSGLPAGVTLQAIDGESMTDATTMTHNYYARNNFTRVTAGTFNPSWDSTSFWPIMSFYLDSHLLPRAVDLGYNVGIDDVFGAQVWANYDVSKIWHYSAQPGAGGPPNPASDFVAGWYTDEPVTDTVDQSNSSPLFYGNQPGTSIAGGPTLITQTSHSIAGGLFGSSQGGSVGPPMTSVTLPNTFWTTPNPGSQHRGVDINGTDFYWFAYSTATAYRKPDCASMINHDFTSPACTTDQMARCSGYGNMVSAMRSEWFGNGAEPETVAATTPLGVFTENGAGNDATNGSRQITPGEMICSVWDAIIHGARATLYFYWVDVASLATNDPIYVATKSTNALIKAQAQMLNAPFARDYLTLAVSDGNANSYVFPHWNSVVATGWFGGGIDAAVKWFGSKFYIVATTKYGESGYATKTATFNLAGGAGTTATVIYSSDNASPPSIPITTGRFTDTFPHPWSVRIYRID